METVARTRASLRVWN